MSRQSPSAGQSIVREVPSALSQVLSAYDGGVLACNSGDYVTAHRAIGLLRAALDLESEVSRSFDSLFAWCEEAIDRGDYAGASRCLAALRGAWKTASLVRPLTTPTSSERFARGRRSRDIFTA